MIDFNTDPAYYCGVGSRETPAVVQGVMMAGARILERKGWVLRSGGAEGADTAFEVGVTSWNHKQIFLPWPRFNGSTHTAVPITDEALRMAERFHPAWGRLSPGARKLHARNCYQVLGADLRTPAKFVLCWTRGGELVGGTAQALRIAAAYNVPIYNLGAPEVLNEFRQAIQD